MPTIQLEKVSKYYPSGPKKLFRRQPTVVGVEGINLTIQQGEFVLLVGGRGCGRTTLLDLIDGSIRPDRGTVRVGDYSMGELPPYGRRAVSLLFGRVWQEQQTLTRKQTVSESLQATARLARHRGESEADRAARAEKVLGLVGMSGAGRHYPVELSIGQCRRVELARALINSPAILLLDEISANLDDDNTWDILHVLREVNRKGTTVVMATHPSRYVSILQQRVIRLSNGWIISDTPKGRAGDAV